MKLPYMVMRSRGHRFELVVTFCLLALQARVWCADRCYSCNSGWPICAADGFEDSPNKNYVTTIPCMNSVCYIRRNANGVVSRGCSKWEWSMRNLEPNTCTTVGGDYICLTDGSNDRGIDHYGNTITTGAGCDPLPQEYMETLPSGCSTPHVTVSKCSGSTCIPDSPSPGQDTLSSYCCSPTIQETVTVSCAGFDLLVTDAKECGCLICNQVVVGGTTQTKNTRIIFVGHAHDADDRNNHLPFANTVLDGTESSTSNINGYFQFELAPGTQRITISVKEGAVSKNLVETVKVFYIPAGFSGTLYKDIPMIKRTTIMTIDSTLDNFLGYANDGNGSLGEVHIPPGSFRTESGGVYTGQVEAGITFVDPRQISSINSMVGDLTYVDGSQISTLQTFGMIHLSFKDSNNNPLNLLGQQIEISISSDFIGAPSGTSSTDVKLWTLNPATGRWEFESTLNRGTGSGAGRKKRAMSDFMSTFFVGDIVITDRYWINFDRPNLNYCYINIKTYSDDTYTGPLSWTQYTTATVIALDPTQVVPWNQVTTSSSTVDYFSGASSVEGCILTVCGNGTFHGYIFAENENGAFSSSPQLGGNGIVPEVSNFIPSIEGGAIHDRPIETTVSPLTTEGPLYYSDMAECRDPTGPFCTGSDCFPVASSPFCDLCDTYKCQFPGTLASAKCRSASINDPHYKFYRNPVTLYEYSACGDIFSCISISLFWPLVWFPEAPTSFWAWYIKVRVEKGDTPLNPVSAESSVRAVSKGGVHPQTIGQVFGVREDTTTDSTVCIEFKGSGNIIEQSGTFSSIPDETIVDIFVQGTGCSVSNVAPGLDAYKLSSLGSLPFIFQVPAGTANGGTGSGLYFANSFIDAHSAKALARARCECGDIMSSIPSCTNIQPELDVGVTISCSFGDGDFGDS